MARHTIGYDELNGFEVETQIASTGESPGHVGKSLSVITTVGEASNVIYRVYNRTALAHFDYNSYGDALQAYNWM